MLAASNTRREQGASLQKFLILLKVSDFFHSYSTRDSAAITVMSLEGTSSSSGDGGTSSAAGLATEGVRTPLSEEDFKRITDAVISALRAPAAPAASSPSISGEFWFVVPTKTHIITAYEHVKAIKSKSSYFFVDTGPGLSDPYASL